MRGANWGAMSRSERDLASILQSVRAAVDAGAEADVIDPRIDAFRPRIFSVETVLACDLRCPECAIGGDRIDGRKRAVHDFDTFKRIADKIRPHAQYVYLHVWGEPMLNQHIFDIIEHTSQFARTNISTNGNSLTEDKAARLIASGVSDIIVSIDGVSQEVYEKYRVGGDVKKAMRGLMWLQRERLRQRRPVTLMPQFIVFEHNEHERDAFASMCRAIGLEPSFKPAYIALDDSTFKPATDPQMRLKRHASIGEQREAMKACGDPREVFTILSDGSVVVCCHDSNAKTTFGNIFEEDVMTIWNSPRYRKYRSDIITGNAPSFCVDNCLSYQREGQGEAAALISPAQLLRATPMRRSEVQP